MTIWKDVSGLLNADPKRFTDTVKIPRISYSEAIELAFYGATIIHPKTIKPLQNKGISLKVQSFLDPSSDPTVIDGSEDARSLSRDAAVPSYIVKDHQTLVSISPRDYSFMNEHNLQIIFATCDELHIHANMMQTSALMLSICFDYDEAKRFFKALLPNPAEFQELYDLCEWKWLKRKRAYKVTGPNGNSILLQAEGLAYKGLGFNRDDKGWEGFYWSSKNCGANAYCLVFNDVDYNPQWNEDKTTSFSVRLVKRTNHISTI